MTHYMQSVLVLDTETTNLLAEKAEVVEVAAAQWNKKDWQAESLLLGAVNGIPPEASAKNNISNKMIAGLPTFTEAADAVRELLEWPEKQYYVAHNARYDRQVLELAWRRAGFDDYARICDDNSRWLCTWRLSKHLLHHEFSDCEYGLNYLRYRLELPVDDDLQLHRAKDDTYLCAKLFDFLVQYAFDNKWIDDKYAHDPLTTLNVLCWQPLPIDKWPFGKYKGTALKDVPNDYYVWAFKNIPALDENNPDHDWDLVENIKIVLEERLSS